MLSLGGAGGSIESLLFDVGLTARLNGLPSLLSRFATRGLRLLEGVIFVATGTGSTGDVLDAEDASD
jgi:hypothetical protein